MADDADRSDDRIEATIAAGVEAARLKVKPPKHYTNCLNCEDKTSGGSPYCCAECRDDYEKYLRITRITGKQRDGEL